MENCEFDDSINVKSDLKNSLAFYISNAKRYPILTREQEYDIAVMAMNGDGKARDKLINSNLLLVVKIANEYVSVFSNLMDLIQEGNYGALRALDKYDPSKGYRFSTYLGWWARSMILRYIFNNSHMIKPGTSNEHKKLFYNLRKEQKRLEVLGIDADAATIASNLNVSEKDVIDMDGRLQTDVSLDIPSYVSNDDVIAQSTIGDSVAIPSEDQPDSMVEKYNYHNMLKHKLDLFANKLSDRQRDIFYKRIISEDPMTLQDLGNTFGITKERTRQIEENIMANLKKYLKYIVA